MKEMTTVSFPTPRKSDDPDSRNGDAILRGLAIVAREAGILMGNRNEGSEHESAATAKARLNKIPAEVLLQEVIDLQAVQAGAEKLAAAIMAIGLGKLSEEIEK
jgi:hypothetical protein